MLLRHLPQDSHYQTALRDTLEIEEPAEDSDPVFGPWGLVHYQMAALIDAVRQLQLITAQAHSEGRLDPIEPTPRPHVKRKRSAVVTEAMAILQRIRDEHAQRQKEAGP